MRLRNEPVRRRAAAFVGVAVLGSALLAGCGNGTSSDLSGAAASLLQRDADALATAARLGDGTAVQAALATLRRDVAAQQAGGGLSAARAQRVLAAGTAVATDVPAPKPTVSARPVATKTPAPAPARRKKRGKEHGD